MPTKQSDLKALTGKFLIFSRRGYWELCCIDCDARWSLDKKPDLHPGNLLSLLNHAAGHQMTPEEREEARKEGIEKGREKLRKVNQVLNSWMRSQL